MLNIFNNKVPLALPYRPTKLQLADVFFINETNVKSVPRQFFSVPRSKDIAAFAEYLYSSVESCKYNSKACSKFVYRSI